MQMNVNIRKGYSTHMALLLEVLDHSEGEVWEFGGGIFSTPLLHWYCKNKGRKLITFEEDELFYNFSKQFKGRDHDVIRVEKWEDIEVKPVGLLFIDHGGKKFGGGWRRGLDAIRFKDHADYIVLHDTEDKYNKAYAYDVMFPQFKYRYDWKKCAPETSVISNLKDLVWLENSQ